MFTRLGVALASTDINHYRLLAAQRDFPAPKSGLGSGLGIESWQ